MGAQWAAQQQERIRQCMVAVPVFSANGLGILNSPSQPTVGPCSHVADSPWTDSVGTIAMCSWPAAVWPLGGR